MKLCLSLYDSTEHGTEGGGGVDSSRSSWSVSVTWYASARLQSIVWPVLVLVAKRCKEIVLTLLVHLVDN